MTDLEFLGHWGLLCERHGRTPSAPLTRMYALTLRAEHLTAEEWAAAVAASLRFDDFMPSIQRLIDHVRTSHKTLALAEWDACIQRVTAGQPATEPATLTRTIMNHVTNGTPLGQVDNDRLPWLKREFVERYAEHIAAQAKQRTPALTNGTQPAEVSAATLGDGLTARPALPARQRGGA